MLFRSHGGPILLDNNVITGQIYNTSRNVIFTHNLFFDCRWYFMVENMASMYWEPHSAKVVEILPLTHLENDRNLNNIYIKKGADQIINAHGYQIGHNVYYDNARKGFCGEENSIVSNSFPTAFSIQSQADGVVVSFLADDSPYKVNCPLISYDFIGVYALTGQGLEDHEGNPICIDKDLEGKPRHPAHPAAGPFEKLAHGINSFQITAGPQKSERQ